MKILHSISNFFYVLATMICILLIFSIPKCGHAQRYFKATDFKNSQFRGYNGSYINILADLTAKDLPKAKESGANHVRLWIGIKHNSANSYYYCNYSGTQISSPLTVIDSAVRLCEKLKLPMILTVEVHPRQAAVDWWGNQSRKDSISAFWKMLATRYKDKKIIAAYDLMNEPRVNQTYKTAPSPDRTDASLTKEYIDFTRQIYSAIKTVDTNHVIAVEVLNNEMLGDSYMATIADSTKSTYLKNVIYSPHGYSPIKITLQGAGGGTVPLPFPDPTSATYNNTTYFANTSYWGTPRDFANKYKAVLWFGEFSCLNWAPKNAQGLWSSTVWIQSAINYMHSIGASWAYHAWNEYQGFNPLFPSSWYYNSANGVTFTSARPSKMPPSSAKSETAPTYLVLKQEFTKNDTLLMHAPFTGTPPVEYITCPTCNGSGRIIKP